MKQAITLTVPGVRLPGGKPLTIEVTAEQLRQREAAILAELKRTRNLLRKATHEN